MVTEAEIGVSEHVPRNARDCWQPSKTRKEENKDSSQEPAEGAWPCQHHDLGILISEKYERKNKFLFKSPKFVVIYRGIQKNRILMFDTGR